jgi:hypothetical protein
MEASEMAKITSMTRWTARQRIDCDGEGVFHLSQSNEADGSPVLTFSQKDSAGRIFEVQLTAEQTYEVARMVLRGSGFRAVRNAFDAKDAA